MLIRNQLNLKCENMYILKPFCISYNQKILDEYCSKMEKIIRKERKMLSRKPLVPKSSPGKPKGKDKRAKMNPVNLEN